MLLKNTQVRMARHPDKELIDTDFVLQESEIPEPAAGEVLIQVIYLSLDPYIRPMMDPVRSYAPHLNPGDVMPGLGVGRVIKSHSSEAPVGAIVSGRFGWQEYAVAPGAGLRHIDPRLGPISTALGVLGMPGATAHYGLMELGRPKAGDTVVVSAASGAVGSLVGQIAKIKGCRVIGIAGGPEKCSYVVNELGFDACLDYREPELAYRLEQVTPKYIDISFENVGGTIMETVMGRLNDYARVVLCGAISEYNSASKPRGFPVFELVRRRASMKGFIISEHMEYWPLAFAEISQWIKEKHVVYRESTVEGLNNAPAAFKGLLSGRNFGKQLVKISAEA